MHPYVRMLAIIFAGSVTRFLGRRQRPARQERRGNGSRSLEGRSRTRLWLRAPRQARKS